MSASCETGLPSSGRAAGGIIQIKPAYYIYPASPITQRTFGRMPISSAPLPSSAISLSLSLSPFSSPFPPRISISLSSSVLLPRFKRHWSAREVAPPRLRAREDQNLLPVSGNPRLSKKPRPGMPLPLPLQRFVFARSSRVSLRYGLGFLIMRPRSRVTAVFAGISFSTRIFVSTNSATKIHRFASLSRETAIVRRSNVNTVAISRATVR